MPSQSNRASTMEFRTQCNSMSARRKHWKREGSGKKRMRASMRRLKAEMAEIKEQQKHIKEGHKEIREKFEEIESECNHLREETKIISQKSACNKMRLNLMFSILKARQENNFTLADYLTGCLREELEKLSQAKASFG